MILNDLKENKIMINFNQDIINSIISLREDNKSKDEISSYLFNILEIESNHNFSLIQSYLSKSKISFKRKSSNWDSCIEFFKSDIKKSRDNLVFHLLNDENINLDEKGSEKYGSSYFMVLNEIYKINNS